jgi:hypothetical protein
VNQYVDIAIGSTLVTRHGTEQRQTGDAELAAQVRPVRAQAIDRLFSLHGVCKSQAAAVGIMRVPFEGVT